jgi:hypothetical protein
MRGGLGHMSANALSWTMLDQMGFTSNVTETEL